MRIKMIVWGCLLIGSMPGCATFESISPLSNLEKRLVYHPRKLPPAAENIAEKAGFEDVEFHSRDGTPLNGWFLDHPNPAAIALFCHGNAGSIANCGPGMKVLNERHRLAVFTFDYRGYGQSAGNPSEQGILSDARAARKWLAQRKGIEESEIVLMGRSLGGAVAIDLASSDGARGLVIASTFTTLPDVANNKLPFLPTRFLMTQRFDSVRKIKNYHGPLLQSHGSDDRLISIENGRRLFDAANEPKRFVKIPGGTHNSEQSEAYRQAFEQFIGSLK